MSGNSMSVPVRGLRWLPDGRSVVIITDENLKLLAQEMGISTTDFVAEKMLA